MGENNKGFSLVELVVTLAIMAVLVGVLTPTLLVYIEKTRESKDTAAIGEFINELYVSASDLENWNGISGNLVFKYDTTNHVLKTIPESGESSFSKEVAEVVGGNIKLESKKWQNANLTITVSPVWDTIHVSGNIPEGYEFSNVTITSNPEESGTE